MQLLAMIEMFAMVLGTVAADSVQLIQRHAEVGESRFEAVQLNPTGHCGGGECDLSMHRSRASRLALEQENVMSTGAEVFDGALSETAQNESADILHVYPPEGDHYVKWRLCNASHHSNLGGLGPDEGAQELRYHEVADVFDSQGNPRALDLAIENISEYTAKAVDLNGLGGGDGCFGQINVKADRTGTNIVTLRFKWYLAGTHTHVRLDRQYLTIYDVDGTRKSTEGITFYNPVHAVYTSDNTELKQSGDLDSGLLFTAEGLTNNVPMPMDPENMTEEQKNRAVTVLYVEKDRFKLEFSVTGGNGGRNFGFSGHSVLAKDPTPSPTVSPTLDPTSSPTASPTFDPTPEPTTSPTLDPTPEPTASPTLDPTPAPTASPTLDPTPTPTVSPTLDPTPTPTASPTLDPTPEPTASPTTAAPTASPTASPTPEPTLTAILSPRTADDTPASTPPQGGAGPTPAPTPTPTSCEEAGTCSVYEDPHIKVFDGLQISLLSTKRRRLADVYGSGDMWLVKSSNISIQGRYLPDPDLPGENLFVRAVAVGGPFLNGNTLILGPFDEEILWNGNPILATQTSEFTAVVGKDTVRAHRHIGSHLVQDMTKTNAGVDVDLPLGVKITVNRYRKHVNVFIQMPPAIGGQDGLCGNFNCRSADDTLDMIVKHRNPKVQRGDSLFKY